MTIQEIIESINYCLECDNDRIPTTQEDLQTIKEELEKQILCKLAPKSSNKAELPFCGKCNSIMDLMQGELNYCPNCGQKIDWSENNG